MSDDKVTDGLGDRRRLREELSDPAFRHELHDVGQAEKFAESLGDKFRWDHALGQWLVWHGHSWRLDEDGGVFRYGIDLAKARFLDAIAEPDSAAQKAITKFALSYQSKRKVADVIELAKNLKPVADDGQSWNLDPYLLGVQNGVIDLRTGLRRDGRPEDRITWTARAVYDPQVACPRWTRFLDEVFGGNSSLITYVQRACGYSATGDTKEQCFFMCVGGGANGKSTFLDTLGYVFGDYSYASPFSTFEHGKQTSTGSDVVALRGRRFVTAEETDPDSRFNEARIKAVTGGGLMNARMLYSAPVEFYPQFKLWFGINHMPVVKDSSFGMWRRVRVIPFDQTFSGENDDQELKATLRAEASGILNWILEGARRWQRHGMETPSLVKLSSLEYRQDQDHLGPFLDERCVVGEGTSVKGDQLYAVYVNWCAGRSHAPDYDGRTFGMEIGRRFHGRRTNSGKVYDGLGLKP